jgi:hypothetical protein
LFFPHFQLLKPLKMAAFPRAARISELIRDSLKVKMYALSTSVDKFMTKPCRLSTNSLLHSTRLGLRSLMMLTPSGKGKTACYFARSAKKVIDNITKNIFVKTQ